MVEQLYSIGEIAKVSKLTIRTIQYYDTIGLLPAQGRTEGGKRYYRESDLFKLQYITFYKNIGFSLKQIKREIENKQFNNYYIKDLLEDQELILYNKSSAIQNSIAAIEASKEIISYGKTPPWMLLSIFMSSLHTIDLSSWKKFKFTQDQKEVFEQFIPTISETIVFYNNWKRLLIKAVAYEAADIPLNSELAQILKKDWLKMINNVTAGDSKNKDAYLIVDNQRSLWSQAEQELITKAEPYLESLLNESSI